MGKRAWELFGTRDGTCRIKLCGMFRDEDADAVSAVRPDLCGFVYGFPKSHRNVDLATLARLRSRVDEQVVSTMVVVDLAATEVADAANHALVDVVQLHGHEDDAYIAKLRSRFSGPIIQAFCIRSEKDVERALASDADMVLLDAGQGSGKVFDWSLIERFSTRRPYILAGGLTPENVGEAVHALRPWGVDMSSGVETDRRKDRRLMAAAVAAVRSAI